MAAAAQFDPSSAHPPCCDSQQVPTPNECSCQVGTDDSCSNSGLSGLPPTPPHFVTNSNGDTESQRAPDDITFALISAYSEDYCAGYITAELNKTYAEFHGYTWECDVLDSEEMGEICGGMKGLPWYKIPMISRMLERQQHNYIVWIDADAFPLNRTESLQAFLLREEASMYDIVLGEDCTVSSLLNTGLVFVKNTEWSRNLFCRLWDENRIKGRPWMEKKFHEQTALERLLRAEDPELFARTKRQPLRDSQGRALRDEAGRWLMQEPIVWFSYRENGAQRKLGQHTCVLPVGCLYTRDTDPPPPPSCFAYHAVGRGGLTKVPALLTAVEFCTPPTAPPGIAPKCHLLRPLEPTGGPLSDDFFNSTIVPSLVSSPFVILDLSRSKLTATRSAAQLGRCLRAPQCAVELLRLAGCSKLVGGDTQGLSAFLDALGGREGQGLPHDVAESDQGGIVECGVGAQHPDQNVIGTSEENEVNRLGVVSGESTRSREIVNEQQVVGETQELHGQSTSASTSQMSQGKNVSHTSKPAVGSCRLRKLDASFCNLHGEAIETLANAICEGSFPRLTLLDVCGNHLTADEVSMLEQALRTWNPDRQNDMISENEEVVEELGKHCRFSLHPTITYAKAKDKTFVMQEVRWMETTIRTDPVHHSQEQARCCLENTKLERTVT